MSEELVCITCPLGCHLTIERKGDDELLVSGNRCPRGVKYANEELLSPKRVVTATARVLRLPQESQSDSLGLVARLPVRSTGAYPKEAVGDLLKAIYALEVTVPVKRGTVLISNFKGSGVDVIAARTLLE